MDLAFTEVGNLTLKEQGKFKGLRKVPGTQDLLNTCAGPLGVHALMKPSLSPWETYSLGERR